MYLIDYVQGAKQNEQEGDVAVEFRLCCSGTIYQDGIIGDWRKSDARRILLTRPFQLIVASDSAEEYPQEVALRFLTASVTERQADFSHTFLPSHEIARDVCALLTLYCRRLFTVVSQVRERYTSELGIPEVLQDLPRPIMYSSPVNAWKRRPAYVVYGLNGQDFVDHQPPPRAIDRARLEDLLFCLPRLSIANSLIRAARLYSLAMELIETQVEISYQLLISAVETMAGEAFKGWCPTKTDQLRTKEGLRKAAIDEGLGESAAKRIALEACKDNPWSRRKFKEFLKTFADPCKLEVQDDLFIVPDEARPKNAQEMECALNAAYSCRSGATHSGESFPATAVIGPSPNMPIAAIHDIISGRVQVPPIGWLERVASEAISTYVKKCVAELDNESGSYRITELSHRRFVFHLYSDNLQSRRARFATAGTRLSAAAAASEHSPRREPWEKDAGCSSPGRGDGSATSGIVSAASSRRDRYRRWSLRTMHCPWTFNATTGLVPVGR